MDDLASHALRKILNECDKVAAQRLVDAFNNGERRTVATTTMVCSQIMGTILAECPEDVRDDFWKAFEGLVFGMMKLNQEATPC